MSSVAGLLVPNNFNIASSGGDIAEGLYSANNTNVINVTAAANPTNGQVLTATGANAATWQAPFSEVTASNAVTFTNKTLNDVSNEVTAKRLHYTGGSINVSASAPPSAGQVLTATGVGAASWLAPAGSVNSVEGGFSGFGAQAAETVLTTIDLGSLQGSVFIRGHVTANINTGTSSSGWTPEATFHVPLGGGNVVLDQTATPLGIGSNPMNTEVPPVWEIVPASSQIKLVKKGTVNSVWGGSWKYSVSGTV